MRSEKQIKKRLKELDKELIQSKEYLEKYRERQDYDSMYEIDLDIVGYASKIAILNWVLSENSKSDLKKYEAVNKCETLDELADVILSFADKKGMIKGRIKSFNAKSMSEACRNYSFAIHNSLTREFGIRQQALMILLYNQRNNLKDL